AQGQSSAQPPTTRGTTMVSFSRAENSVTFSSGAPFVRCTLKATDPLASSRSKRSFAATRAPALAWLLSKLIARSPDESKTRSIFIDISYYPGPTIVLAAYQPLRRLLAGNRVVGRPSRASKANLH